MNIRFLLDYLSELNKSLSVASPNIRGTIENKILDVCNEIESKSGINK